MKLKRAVGAGKIFLYSCGIVTALAGAVWLIINGVYAVYISGKEPGNLWVWSYTRESFDIVTPWLLMAAAAVIYYRYYKMCGANSVSCIKQTAVYVLMSVFIPTVFAAADLLAAKLVMQPLYGGIVVTGLEKNSTYFWKIIREYFISLDEDVTEIGSPYTMKTLLLLFTIMAVYYYCFFLAGAYIMQCFRYGRRKTLIYYVLTVGIMFFLESSFPDFEEVPGAFFEMIIMVVIAVVLPTNPVVFLYMLPLMALGDESSVVLFFLMMTSFILITAASIYRIGLKQYPSRRHIKKVLKNYSEKIISKREEKVNDGQT